MSGLKTAAITALALFAQPLHASMALDYPKEFASCAGRYSAMMEHAWLMESPRAGDYERMRETFITLLEAIDGGPGKVRLHRRVDAKFAQASLLHLATFSLEPEIAERAEEQVESHLAFCRGLVLGG